jgi:hypothetical protein
MDPTKCIALATGAVGADQVDFGIVLSVPPSADGLGFGPSIVGQQTR